MIHLPSNLCIVDVETSTLDPATGVIFELGAALAGGARFEAIIRQPVGDDGERHFTAEPEALAVNGWTPERNALATHEDEESAIADLIQWLVENTGEGDDGQPSPRYLFAGKNPDFDWRWLERYWPSSSCLTGPEQLWSRRRIDLHSWAYLYGMGIGLDLTAEEFSTDDIYTVLGLSPEPLPHRALGGAQHELFAFGKLLSLVSPGLQSDALESRDALIEAYRSSEYQLAAALRGRDAEVEEQRKELARLRDELELRERELAAE